MGQSRERLDSNTNVLLLCLKGSKLHMSCLFQLFIDMKTAKVSRRQRKSSEYDQIPGAGGDDGVCKEILEVGFVEKGKGKKDWSRLRIKRIVLEHVNSGVLHG